LAAARSSGKHLSRSPYGDFLVDRLEPGTYELAVTAAGYECVTRTVVIEASVNLGVLFFQK
jgi:hypothetical protein